MVRKNKFKPKGNKLRGKGAYYPGGRVLRGKGGFFDDLGNIFKGAIGPVVGALGKAADSVIPGAGTVASGITKLIGVGAYTPVKSNAILAQPVPKVGSSQDQGVRYRHEEYLGDVTSSEDWELTQFHVNPGLAESFPWLSTIASNFQKYRINGLVFYLKSTSSSAIANTSDLGLGTVLGAFQYNVYDPPPSSKVEFLALSGSGSGKPSDDHIYPMECDPSKIQFKNLLVRSKGQVDDLAKYDHATLNLATVGFPGVYNLGELWVSYDVTLIAPRVQESQQFMHSEIGAFNVGLVHQVGADAVVLVPPADLIPDRPGYMRNTLNWTSSPTNNEGGTPVAGFQPHQYEVAPGTNGIFMFTFTVTTNAGNFNDVPLTWKPVRGGSVVMLDAQHVRQGVYCQYTEIVKIEANPTEPLLMYPACYLGTTTNTGATVTGFRIVRLPDNYYRATTTGSGVVSTHTKVRRGPSNGPALRGLGFMTRAASAASVEELDTSSDRKEAPIAASSKQQSSPFMLVQEAKRR